MPDEYDAARKNLTNYEKGLYFELGRAHEMGETPDRGWVKQFRIQTPKGPRILDNARTVDRGIEAKERKSGRVNERDACEQIAKEHASISTGQIVRSTWETVVGEKVPEKTLELMRITADATKGKFQHVEISREAAARSIVIGKSLASQQLELIKPYELQRADRARERLAKIRVIVKAREEKERAQAAERDAARRVALEFPAPEHLRRIEAPTTDRAKERETPQTERDRVTREAGEKAVREFQARLKSGPEPSTGKAPEKTTPERETPEAARARVERKAREQVLREFPFPVPSQAQERETVEIGERSTPDPNQAASVAREAADKAKAAEREAEAREAERRQTELDQKRDAAYREMLNQPQVPEHIRLGLSHAQAPQAAVRTPPGQAPSVERGGTRGLDARGIERTR
ncbi:hypothetical protein OG203_24615 [Nocardia sp. NBC_01499]|uniref:hypothetical protein n=1 Tax=Nocardia sp. NBC_01499 TaxID=2903597 RepID=UPI00386D0922